MPANAAESVERSASSETGIGYDEEGVLEYPWSSRSDPSESGPRTSEESLTEPPRRRSNAPRVEDGEIVFSPSPSRLASSLSSSTAESPYPSSLAPELRGRRRDDQCKTGRSKARRHK